MLILCSAFTLCLVAVLAITAEARHVKTRTRGSAKMLSLIEKTKVNTRMNPILMKKHAKTPQKVGSCYVDERMCPAGWCCHFAYKCCPEDSPNQCVGRDSDCYDAPEGDWMNPLLMKLEAHAQVRDDDDCPGMVCPGDWCCDDTDLICCDEDSDMICVPDAHDC